MCLQLSPLRLYFAKSKGKFMTSFYMSDKPIFNKNRIKCYKNPYIYFYHSYTLKKGELYTMLDELKIPVVSYFNIRPFCKSEL